MHATGAATSKITSWHLPLVPSTRDQSMPQDNWARRCRGAHKAPLLMSQSRACSSPSNPVLKFPFFHAWESQLPAEPCTSNSPPYRQQLPELSPPPFLTAVILPGQLASGDSIWYLPGVPVTEKLSHQQERAKVQNSNSAGFRAELRPSAAHLYITSTATIHHSFLTRHHGCHHFNNTHSSTLTDLHSQSLWASISC